MPILIFILLVVAIAHVGFWDTLQAVFGAIGVIVLFFLIMAGLVASVIAYMYAKVRRRF